MAGIHFTTDNFKELIDLTIGISKRLDENRAESFTLLYCSFAGIDTDLVRDSLMSVLRTSDSIVNFGSDYYFVLPYTDKFGANIVKTMFEKFFDQEIKSHTLSYPIDGESSEDLLELMQNSVSTKYALDLIYLDDYYMINEQL